MIAAGLFTVIRSQPDLVASLRPPDGQRDHAAAITASGHAGAGCPGAIDRWRIGERQPDQTLPIAAVSLDVDGTDTLLAVVTSGGGVEGV